MRRDNDPVASHGAFPPPAAGSVTPREWAHRSRRAALTAGAHARGVRLRGLIVETGGDEVGLIVVTVERVALGCSAPALRVMRGAERAATVTLRGDSVLRRNGRAVPLARLRVGDFVRVRGGAGAARASATDARHG